MSDQATLERLREAGADLDSVHEITAFLYFSGEQAARRALPGLEAAGYVTFPAPVGTPDGKWVVEAAMKAAPTSERIAAMRSELRRLAQPGGGQYDGWAAHPLPDEEVEAASTPE